jgi:rubrerythrin
MTFEYASFEKTIAQLEANPELHARFVNTLSLLEYMGARKILKSQREEKISSQVLAHAAEEIRHAQTFKRLALKMSSGKLSSYSEDHLLCGKEAREYFQSLDQAVHAEIGEDSYTNYLFTTLLIEERANLVYPIYEPVLARAGYPGVLKAIVKEEDAHLKDILTSLQEQGKELNSTQNRAPVSVEKMIELRMLEATAFEKFISSVYVAAQNLRQDQASGGKFEATSGEPQPGLTRGSQDSRSTIRPNANPSPNHANASAPQSKG